MVTNLGLEGILNQINVMAFSRYFHHVIFYDLALKYQQTWCSIFSLHNIRLNFSHHLYDLKVLFCSSFFDGVVLLNLFLKKPHTQSK